MSSQGNPSHNKQILETLAKLTEKIDQPSEQVNKPRKDTSGHNEPVEASGLAPWPMAKSCAQAANTIPKILVEIQMGRVTNGWWVSSNYTTYILVSPSCNIPANSIRCDWSHQLHRADLHEILIPIILTTMARSPAKIPDPNKTHHLTRLVVCFAQPHHCERHHSKKTEFPTIWPLQQSNRTTRELHCHTLRSDGSRYLPVHIGR